MGLCVYFRGEIILQEYRGKKPWWKYDCVAKLQVQTKIDTMNKT